MTSITGNARGYYLKSDYFNYQIPISRSMKKDELKKLITWYRSLLWNLLNLGY